MRKKRIAIFISGRGSNMAAIIQNSRTGLLKECCEVVLVLSNKKGAKGIQIAQEFQVPALIIESKGKLRQDFEREISSQIAPERIDYIVLAGFMRILTPWFVQTFRNRIINIHPADTAKHRGLGGYQWALKNRLDKTWITVHFVDEGVDSGPVIGKMAVDLQGATTLSEIEARGLAVEHQFYSRVLRDVFTGKIKEVGCVVS